MTSNLQAMYAAFKNSMPSFPAAAGAYAIVFPLFAKKSGDAIGESVQFGVKMWFNGARTTAPIVTLLLGSQLVAQKGLSFVFTKEGSGPSKTAIVASSVITGLVTVPIAAALNAATMPDLSPMEAVRKMTLREGSAIGVRETGFVLTMAARDPIYRAIIPYTGESITIEKVTAVVVAIIGSLLTQPADTAATRMQKGLPVTWSCLMKGSAPRALAVSGFGILYDAIEKEIRGMMP